MTVTDLDTGMTRTESYDHLVLSLGAAPVRPPIQHGALTLRDVADVDRMLAASEAAAAAGASAVVIGAGFIGVEVVENLRHRGLNVTLVELADQVLPRWSRNSPPSSPTSSSRTRCSCGCVARIIEIGPDTVTTAKSWRQIWSWPRSGSARRPNWPLRPG